ncbi:FeoA family protein [uncultured Xylophilus sp.]|uniref:FeoA family protein n=1 Tax=uncultured Xylophilus sp. TaxID=296832 RepID=UPI0025FF539B|nr:FeoA family protein [uncultured Xylophilus sp.]
MHFHSAAADPSLFSPAPLSLDRLPRQQPATIVSLQPSAGQEGADVALRLSEIGFVPGETVRVVAHGFPGREPLAVRVGQSTFALRLHEAAMVTVVPGGSA